MDSSTVICWTSPFVILGVSGLICRFYSIFDGWLVGCFGFNGPLRSISVYIGPSPKERETEERKNR